MSPPDTDETTLTRPEPDSKTRSPPPPQAQQRAAAASAPGTDQPSSPSLPTKPRRLRPSTLDLPPSFQPHPPRSAPNAILPGSDRGSRAPLSRDEEEETEEQEEDEEEEEEEEEREEVEKEEKEGPNQEKGGEEGEKEKEKGEDQRQTDEPRAQTKEDDDPMLDILEGMGKSYAALAQMLTVATQFVYQRTKSLNASASSEKASHYQTLEWAKVNTLAGALMDAGVKITEEMDKQWKRFENAGYKAENKALVKVGDPDLLFEEIV